MKIIGPIAGIGSRLRPFTLSKPKAFLTVAGKTVLDHILLKFTNTFESDTELILIVGYKKRHIGNGGQLATDIVEHPKHLIASL